MRALPAFLFLLLLAAPAYAQSSVMAEREQVPYEAPLLIARHTVTGSPVHLQPMTVRRTPNRDHWWARDKAKHVAFSLLWTLGTQYVLVNKAGWAERDALPASAGSAVGVGLSKEMYDWRLSSSHHFSLRDLVADAVGISLAIGLIVL